MTQYRAFKTPFGNGAWRVERSIVCINGLAAWFVVCDCEETSEQEMGYSDGAHGTAQDRAERIAAALNGVQVGS